MFMAMIGTTGFAYNFSYTLQNASIDTSDNQTYLLEFNLSFRGFQNDTDPVFFSATPVSSFFNIFIAPRNFIILNDTNKTVVIQVSIPEFYLEGNYTSELIFERKNSTTTAKDVIPIVVKIHPTFNFSVSPEFNLSVNTSDKGTFNMEIATIGNVDSVLDIEVVQRFGIIDEEDIDIIIEPLPNIILPYRDTLPIYRKSQLSIPFFFTVPRELKGIHKETILFRANNITIERNITFNITDSEVPVIQSIVVESNTKIYKPFTVTANITDNIAVDKVFLTTSCLANATRMRQSSFGYYEVDLAIQKIGLCNLIISVNDTSGNSDVEFANVTLDKLGGVEITGDTKNPKFRYGKPFTTQVMSTLRPVNVTVTLTELIWQQYIYNTETNTTELTRSNVSVPSVAINYDGINVLIQEGETKNISLLTDLFVTITGEQNGFYRVFLKTGIPIGILEESNHNIEVEGEIADYTVTRDYTGKLIDRPAECRGYDLGVYENSSYRCTLDFPVDTPLDSISFPYPKTFLEKALADKDTEIAKWFKEAEWRGLLNLIIGLGVIGLLITIFIWRRASEGLSF